MVTTPAVNSHSHHFETGGTHLRASGFVLSSSFTGLKPGAGFWVVQFETGGTVLLV